MKADLTKYSLTETQRSEAVGGGGRRRVVSWLRSLAGQQNVNSNGGSFEVTNSGRQTYNGNVGVAQQNQNFLGGLLNGWTINYFFS